MQLILDKPRADFEEYDLPDLPKLAYKHIEWLPPLPPTNALWKEWVPEVMQHRAKVVRETSEKWKGQQAARETEVYRVKKDGRYWLTTYGAIYEAKDEANPGEEEDWVTDDPEKASGWVLPFIPYLFQYYYWDWQMKAFRTRGAKGDTAIVKTRQMGMSNMACAIFNWAWMVRKPFQGRLLSRKEELVDETNNPDSLFWKLKLQLSSQPDWLLQAFAPGFDWRRDYMSASLTNPANFNHLAGESTNATAGRGGTATAILLDEYAFMRGGAGIWTATRPSTHHRIAISTVHMKFGPHFYNLVHQPDDSRPAIMVIPYWLHPDHDAAWLEQERKRDTEAGIQTEVLMNWFGDESVFVYPALGSQETGNYPYIPLGGPVFVAFDNGFRNSWALFVIQYVQATGKHRILDAYFNRQKVVDYYGSIFRGVKLDGFEYGPNEDRIMDLLRYVESPIYVADPHINNVQEISGESTSERLANRWKIYVNVDFAKRDYIARQEFTARNIPKLEWNDTPGTRDALLKVKTFKWKEPAEGAEPTSVPKEPVKNESSHFATALEYYFGNFEGFGFIYSGTGFSYE
jgi:hypothetical protein